MKFLLKFAVFFSLIIPTLFVYRQANASPTDSVKLLIDTTLSFAKTKSIFREKVNWSQIESQVRAKAAGAKTVKEAIPAIKLLFEMLGDHHAFMNYQGKYYSWRVPSKAIDTPTYKNLIEATKQEPTLKSQMLAKGYGYLLIPANNPRAKGDQDRIGQEIQSALNKLDPSKLKGLVIDLRLNTGGAMFAMLGGIANLFKPGNLGAFVGADGKEDESWGVTPNSAYSGKDTYCTIANIGAPASNLKVVVLLSRFTASSGEAVAISFKGRKNTMFIGENTGGYTTANDSFWLAYSLGVFMSTAIEADRNGNAYWKDVQPDQIIIGGDNFENLNADKKIIAALNWLKTDK
ncbi:S41 family peptidase [Pedobacter sandarakinus]|uniref:S41 family peptidase n=1 Tax=Pedobacter sandarakinus TaxID=353156 RepID=UPI002245C02E|nr:S41 family peptidase [Pedobacter sandarakinus]MCX2575632.1 S41 family peptidase [Pedobacter sandarakinus]